MYTTEISTYQQLKEIESSIEELASHTNFPNAFYEPALLVPAFENYSNSSTALIAVWENDSLCTLNGLFPIEKRWSYYGIPIPHAHTWLYPHCYLCSPLIRAGLEQQIMSCFLKFLQSHRLGGYFFGGAILPASGSFQLELESFLTNQDIAGGCTETHFRCIHKFTQNEQADQLNAKQRKRFKQKWKALQKLGSPNLHTLNSVEELNDWVTDFFALEGSGWKGEAQTSLGASNSDRRFFRESVSRAFDRSSLLFLKLTLDGAPIAMRCSFLSGSTAYSFKTAYNENYSKCSPGYLLEAEYMHHIASETELKVLDSCSAPSGELFKRLYNSEQELCRYQVSYESPVSKMIVKTISQIQQLWRARPRKLQVS